MPAPSRLSTIACFLLALAQVVIVLALIWPFSSGIGRLGALLLVGSVQILLVGTAIVLVIVAWVSGHRSTGSLRIAIGLLVVLPLANLVYLTWWPTSERLVYAAQDGEIAVVMRCLNWGIAPDSTFTKVSGFGGRGDSQTALTKAASGGHIEIAELLIDRGAKVQGHDHAALLAALHGGHPRIAHLLAQHSTSVEGVMGEFNFSQFGMRAGQIDALAALLDVHQNAVYADWLYLPAMYARKNAVALTLATAQKDVPITDPALELLLAIAEGDSTRSLNAFAELESALKNHTATDQRLKSLQKRFPLRNRRQPVQLIEYLSAERVLLFAAKFGIEPLVTQLLARAVPPDPPLAEKAQPRSPLNLAAEHGHRKIVQALLAAGADIHRSGESFGTPLHAAVLGDQPAMIELLLDFGAAIDAPQNRISSTTPLALAVLTKNLPVLELLLLHGADPTLRNPGGNSACGLSRRYPSLTAALETHC